jgi:hypothetical protein
VATKAAWHEQGEDDTAQQPHRGKESKMTNTNNTQDLAQKVAERLAKQKAELAAKYPHAKVDTLQFDTAAGNGGKFKVQIKCTCGDETRWVYTSDLFQVKLCAACGSEAKKAKKEAKKAELKAALELIKSGAVK